jgi:hypothetical protein
MAGFLGKRFRVDKQVGSGPQYGCHLFLAYGRNRNSTDRFGPGLIDSVRFVGLQFSVRCRT